MSEKTSKPAPGPGVTDRARMAAWRYDTRSGRWSWPSGVPRWLPDGSVEDLHTLVAHTEPAFGAELTRALAGRDAFRITLPLATSAKTRRWLRVEGARGEAGNIEGLVQDVTDAKRVEQALKSEILRYRHAAADARVAVFAATLPNWQMLHVGPALEDLTGYGQDTWLSQPDFLRQIAARDDKEVLSPARLLRDEDPAHHLSFRVRRADGRETELDAIFRVHRQGAAASGFARGVIMPAGQSSERAPSVAERERHLKVLYDENPAMFFSIGADGIVRSANQYGATRLGYRPEELIGTRAIDVHLASHRTQVTDYFAHCLDDPTSVHHWETCLMRKDGGDVWVRASARAIDADGEREVLVVCEDITEARQLSEKLRYQENYDLLTGLANRRRFERELGGALSQVRAGNRQHVLCYLDLDHFKVINETCGHHVGDKLLLKVSRLLCRHVRECDVLGRLGGDEFAILYRGCSRDDALRRAEEICRALASERFEAADRAFRVTGSIGVVDLATAVGSMPQLLSFADSACFAAKDQGRNRVVLYHADNLEIIRRKGEMAWVSRLQDAVDHDRFELFCQPIRSLSRDAGRGDAFEVLLRLPDEAGHEFIKPDVFLRAAENYQLAVRVDAWVTERVIRLFERYPSVVDGLDLCCINLSSQSITDKGFLEQLQARLRDHPALAAALCFEITETGVIANLHQALYFIRSLQELGCRFALDDFGSGVSSFAYLKELPVNVVKIDGMFARNVAVDPIDRALVASINDIAHAMGKLTVAEYVEDETAMGCLREMGVDYAQGYYLATPQPLRDHVAPPRG